MEEQEDDNSDEELAPMVDGLSGTLCIIILVSMVFIFSALKTASTYINYGYLNFESVKIDMQKKVIYFKGGISLSVDEITLLKNEFNQSRGEKIIFNGYVNNIIKNSQEKNAYNLLYMSSLVKKIGSNKEVVLQQGNDEYCPEWNSCIYWDYK
ncbi:TPA: hypothetical protein RG647_RS18380 [Providencia rettgeri]|uniref:hypothetical protein n=1 Tax=Providencia sp. PROV129 TaxID=2949839 RepID=UPI00234AE6CD|nr:hypothetical protein [Providencia sp. PROV129]HEC8330318.1 hypothetical protein [Providencia rettgeri]